MIRPTLILSAIAATVLLVAGVAVATPKDDWPKLDGELYINTHDEDRVHTGTDKNDELLGGHGDDTLYGGKGHDVILADHMASGNATEQRDVVHAGSGNDWVYASHGR